MNLCTTLRDIIVLMQLEDGHSTFPTILSFRKLPGSLLGNNWHKYDDAWNVISINEADLDFAEHDPLGFELPLSPMHDGSVHSEKHGLDGSLV